MPIFDSPISEQPRVTRSDQGFTLIEILVVLLIVTILAGLTVARLPAIANDADLDTEVRRLQLLLNMARSDAVMDSTEFGFRLNPRGYEFLSFRDDVQRWEKAAAPYHAREVEEDIKITLRADSEGLQIAGKQVPKLLILSSGEVTPFELTLQARAGGDQKTLTSDGYSEITLKQ